MKKYGTRKLTMLAMTMAVAMVLSYIESQIPAFVAVPGVKVGLANIAVIFALYRFGFKEACLVSCVHYSRDKCSKVLSSFFNTQRSSGRGSDRNSCGISGQAY